MLGFLYKITCSFFTECTKLNKMAALLLIVFYMYKNVMSLTGAGIPTALPTGFQDGLWCHVHACVVYAEHGLPHNVVMSLISEF